NTAAAALAPLSLIRSSAVIRGNGKLRSHGAMSAHWVSGVTRYDNIRWRAMSKKMISRPPNGTARSCAFASRIELLDTRLLHPPIGMIFRNLRRRRPSGFVVGEQSETRRAASRHAGAKRAAV